VLAGLSLNRAKHRRGRAVEFEKAFTVHERRFVQDWLENNSQGRGNVLTRRVLLDDENDAVAFFIAAA
jgi:hypothetical protein